MEWILKILPNNKVDKVIEGGIILKNKNKIKSDYTIIATEFDNLIDQHKIN